jgi:hypothetical protein
MCRLFGLAAATHPMFTWHEKIRPKVLKDQRDSGIQGMTSNGLPKAKCQS